MSGRFSWFLLVGLTFAFASCEDKQQKNHGAIVLNDPSTIVTENDSLYLMDYVGDIKVLEQPLPEPPAPADSNTTAATATQEPAAEQPVQPSSEQGLTVAFKGVTIFIPNIETRTYQDQDLKNANGASYELTKGVLYGNTLRITEGEATRVEQRYKTIIVVKNELGTLPLETLMELTDWKEIKGNNNIYKITGLATKDLKYEKASRGAIRNAVSKAARSQRMSRAMEQKWLNSVKKVRASNQKPLFVVLRSVMWKIDGKDKNGKFFQKQLRMDFPL